MFKSVENGVVVTSVLDSRTINKEISRRLRENFRGVYRVLQ